MSGNANASKLSGRTSHPASRGLEDIGRCGLAGFRSDLCRRGSAGSRQRPYPQGVPNRSLAYFGTVVPGYSQAREATPSSSDFR
jgi:hypothetical protein